MTFRQNGLNYVQLRGFALVMAALCLLAPVVFRAGGWAAGILAGCAVLFVLLFFLAGRWDAYVTMDETGISCRGPAGELWAYDWESVCELRKSRRFSLPSAEVILLDSHGRPEPYGASGRYFQMSKAAKTAVARFAPRRVRGELLP